MAEPLLLIFFSVTAHLQGNEELCVFSATKVDLNAAQRELLLKLLSGITKLEHSNLSHMSLQDLNHIQGWTPNVLHTLDLRANQLTSLPHWLGSKQFGSLKKLLVGDNHFLTDSELVIDWCWSILRMQIVRFQVVTVGDSKKGKSTLLKNMFFESMECSSDVELERTTSVLLLQNRDISKQREWQIRDLPGERQYWASNLNFLTADCTVSLVVCSLEDKQSNRELQVRKWLSLLSIGQQVRVVAAGVTAGVDQTPARGGTADGGAGGRGQQLKRPRRRVECKGSAEDRKKRPPLVVIKGGLHLKAGPGSVRVCQASYSPENVGRVSPVSRQQAGNACDRHDPSTGARSQKHPDPAAPSPKPAPLPAAVGEQ
eukprot:g56802.t1